MFIADYCRLNQQLVINTYPLPRIGETKQQLEGLQYETALDLNTRYYTIILSHASQDMTTIVNEFGKLIYNLLPMGMCASGYILQAKVDELLDDIKVSKTYIDNILVLSKDSYEKHIEHLRIIIGRLHAASLKFNAPMCSFGLKEIPYLYYVTTR